MTRQWLREAALTVFDQNGAGAEIPADLRLKFHIIRATIQSPNTAIITIYNVSDETAARFEQEFKRISLSAGYPGGTGLIFNGTIKQARRGRDSNVDRWIEVVAGDGDVAYNWSYTSASLAAGSTAADRVACLDADFARYGVQPGPRPPELAQKNPSPRGCVLEGNTRDLMRAEAEAAGCDWFIDGMMSYFLPRNQVRDGAAVLLTSETGLIGLPQQTEIGINIRCLINPSVRLGGAISIGNSFVQEYRQPTNYTATPFPPSINRDGLYKVVSMDFAGDTRGQEWYCDMICVAIDDTLRPALVRRGIIPAGS